MLHGLAADGIFLGVVSNKTGALLRREADRLGWSGYFGRLVGAGDAAVDKPDAAPVRLALASSGIAAGEAVWFVGDTASRYGMRAQQRLRAGSAGRRSGRGRVVGMRAAPGVFRPRGAVSLCPGLVIYPVSAYVRTGRVAAGAVACRFGSSWAGSAPKSEWGLPMSAEKSQNVQDVFLNHVRKNKTPVTVFLVNGVKLQGIITWFDNFCVLLRRDAHSQLVYKHAISTVMPAQPIQLFEPGRESDEL